MYKNRAFTGIALLAFGGVLLLDRAGAVDAGAVVSMWWPGLFILAAALAVAERRPNLAAAAVLASVGAGLLLVTAAGLDAGVIWPLILVGAGAWLIIRRTGPRVTSADDDVVNIVAVFSGHEVHSTGGPFRGGTVTALFGGAELDLRDADLADGSVLRVNAAFGGVDITVPPTWRVRMSGPAIFGGYDNHADRAATPGVPTLDVQLIVLFGWAEVKVAASRPVPQPSP